MRDVVIASARARDRQAIERMLAQAGLPREDIGPHLRHFLVARRGGALVGVVGLEPLDRRALLRSLAVRARHRGKGVGWLLCQRIEAKARRQGVKALYLLTTTAEPFFRRAGFRRIARSRAPGSVQRTREFQELCPATAACMVKPLRAARGRKVEMRHAGLLQTYGRPLSPIQWIPRRGECGRA
jgi:amino-acid N-acetyltransferase